MNYMIQTSRRRKTRKKLKSSISILCRSRRGNKRDKTNKKRTKATDRENEKESARENELVRQSD